MIAGSISFRPAEVELSMLATGACSIPQRRIACWRRKAPEWGLQLASLLYDTALPLLRALGGQDCCLAPQAFEQFQRSQNWFAGERKAKAAKDVLTASAGHSEERCSRTHSAPEVMHRLSWAAPTTSGAAI